MSNRYDVIVVGARCAGSPTAMLLARRGYRVLVVDRATFPSDTVSTHLVHPTAAAALDRWGLLEALIATGCPPIDTYAFDFGAFTITGAPGTPALPSAYCPRRTVLDKLLVDAAAAAGAEVREGFAVDEIVLDGARVTGIRGRQAGGATVTETATVVIGADGRHSRVARAVAPPEYNRRPELQCGYYAYWSGLDMNGRMETYIGDRRGAAAMPTHDGLTLVIGGWPFAEFEAQKRDLDASYLAAAQLSPAFAERLRGARRESRVMGGGVANLFRRPYGPGWALVGDAGYCKDPITAQGILDAFLDAEALTAALDAALSDRSSFDRAMTAYQAARDARAMPIYDFTCQLATLEPPPPEMQQLLGAVARTQDAMDGFCRVYGGATSPAEFFAPENVGRIVAAAQGAV